MNRIITILLFSLLANLGINAQDSEKMEKIWTMKMAFITQELDLSEKESEQFFPLYKQYEEEKRNMKKEYQGATADDRIQKQEAQLQLEKTYLDKFSKVLPKEKVDKLSSAEEKFKQVLIKEIQSR